MSDAIRPTPDRPRRLLVIAAHPRDADLAMAGTVARWVGQGTVAQLVCCTSGDGRSDDAEAGPLELAAVREREQREAADQLGYGHASQAPRTIAGSTERFALIELRR